MAISNEKDTKHQISYELPNMAHFEVENSFPYWWSQGSWFYSISWVAGWSFSPPSKSDPHYCYNGLVMKSCNMFFLSSSFRQLHYKFISSSSEHRKRPVVHHRETRISFKYSYSNHTCSKLCHYPCNYCISKFVASQCLATSLSCPSM